MSTGKRQKTTEAGDHSTGENPTSSKDARHHVSETGGTPTEAPFIPLEIRSAGDAMRVLYPNWKGEKPRLHPMVTSPDIQEVLQRRWECQHRDESRASKEDPE